MCTVTYIPKADNTFILTSNRDEAVGRIALAPSFYTIEGVKMLFPKDAVAGGSWIGISDRNRLICLLNGGFESHMRVDTYRMSRGVVLKELLKAEDVFTAIEAFDFSNIEPFTIIAIDWNFHMRAIELVWDGKKRHITPLDDSPRIWSSSMLYDAKMKAKRQVWFAEFAKTTNWEAEELLSFHTTAGDGDAVVDVRMDRGFLKTVSTTQVEKTIDYCSMTYHDFQKGEVHQTTFDLVNFEV
jgi:hypothetical protein|tara:strand:- start:31566 stop:32288 length:723 start_codon:yes stop_codon:yes gene_type:complete